MGTKNLTTVIKNNEIKIAQYGQWDGYPGGQGITILKFLLKTDLSNFSEKINKCKFVDEEKAKEIQEFLKSIGSDDGWMTSSQGILYNERYKYFSRDHGAGILELIDNSEDDIIWLQDSSSFANNSLYCEYGYVIDLDNDTFEVYEGFNKMPLNDSERYIGNRQPDKNGYFPIKLIKIYDLNNLPTPDNFLKDFEEEDEEEDL